MIGGIRKTMPAEAIKKCIVCRQDISSTLAHYKSGYCYRHYQILDSLKNEFAAGLSCTSNDEPTWREFLLQKKQDNLDPDLQSVIEAELAR